MANEAIEIQVPRLGWSMEEGTFAGWLKQDGEAVHRGDFLYALEGDKATQEVESFDEGILRLTPDSPQAGDRVVVGQVLAHLMVEGSSPITTAVPAPSAVPVPIAAPADAMLPSPRPVAAVRGSSVVSTPRARRLAKSLGISLGSLKGTGRGGRIRERDVLAEAGGPPIPSALSPIRRAIAERMVASHTTTAPVTLTTSVDVTALVDLRNQFRATSPAEDVPSFTELVVKLSALALTQNRSLNSSISPSGIVEHGSIHVGFAVDTGSGLLVPVIRDADRLGLKEIRARSRGLIDRARTGKLRADDMRDGTFTITNLGSFGVDAFTPLINLPQAAILGMGRIRTQPHWNGREFVPREMMALSLTFDHRIVDGAPAARFLQDLSRRLEHPAASLIP